jgi:ATP-binding cassette, subfamily B, bacterial
MDFRSAFQQLKTQFIHLRWVIQLLWRESSSRTFSSALLLALEGFWPIAVIYLIRDFVNALVTFLDGHHDLVTARNPLRIVILLGIVMATGEVLHALNSWLRSLQAEHLKLHIEKLIQEQAVKIDLAYFEQADFYDRLHRARQEASYRPALLLDNLASVLQNGITFFSMGALLLQLGFWLPFWLFLSTLPALYVVAHFSRKQFRWKKESTQEERRAWYYDWLLTSGETAAEIRVFNLGGHFRHLFGKIREELVRQKLQLLGQQTAAEITATAIAWLVLGLCLIWMLSRVMYQQVSLGNLALFYQAFSQGQQLLRALLGNLGQIYSNSLFLGNLFEFLSLRPTRQEPDNPTPGPISLEEGIRLDKVNFSYQNRPGMVFENLDLWIPAGKLTAIVGPNGAGKSTLLKLICRLYEPDSGAILWDRIPLHCFRKASIQKAISPLFQDPLRFNGRVRENIGVGDLDRSQKVESIQTAAQAAGANAIIQQLAEQYETLLGTWFAGGTELSHGEWQRMALSRAYFRHAPVLLLDEPTSFMDPWAETEWLAHFREFMSNRTALLITHRLTAASRADLIYVFKQGRVIESGSHQELLEKRGLYWNSWQSNPMGQEP